MAQTKEARLHTAEAALEGLLAIVKHPDAPFWPNLPQVDAVTKWYVKLAHTIELSCEQLDIEVKEE